MVSQHWIPVSQADEVGFVRRQTNRLAEMTDLDETECGKAAIIATELANNLARYAQRGEMLLALPPGPNPPWLDILAIDRGPGMESVARCLEDGFSSGGTPGTGLGAVCRLATEFDIFSTQPAGTVVFARVATKTRRQGDASDFDWGAVCRPAPHETLCGDTWRIAERSGELTVMIADGLGHGPLAADAAEAGAAAFAADPFVSLTEILQSSDRRMRGTRGAAMAAARFAAASGLVKYAGVGNIAGHLRGGGDKSGRGLISHNGTLGVQVRKFQEFDYECPPRGVLIMHSDGLQGRWSFDSYPGLIQRHPAVIAAILYRDFVRGPDDLTVVVARATQK